MDRNASPHTHGCPAVIQNSPETGGRANAFGLMARISAALDIPLDAFKQRDESHGDKARVLAENAEASEIFAGITDRDARQRGLAYLRWIAEQGSVR